MEQRENPFMNSKEKVNFNYAELCLQPKPKN